MKRFLVDILCIFLLILIIICGLEIAQYMIPNSYTYKKNYVDNHKNDISVLLIGHSHMLRGVNPHLLGDSVFNFAESGRWIYYDAKIIERYVPSMPNLRVVVFPMGYDMPLGYLSYHYEHDNLKDYHDYNIHMYEKYMNIPYDRFPMRFTSYSSLLSGYLALDEFSNKQLKCDSLGFEIQDSTIHRDGWEAMHLPHLEDSILCDSSQNNIYLKEYLMYLTEIARVCYSNNVRLVTITTPCSQNYNDMTCQYGIDRLNYIIEEVAKYYPIEYFNYIDEIQSDSFFLDCSHLNYLGAEQFTLRLKKDLEL